MSGIIKKLKGKELVNWAQDKEIDVYPVTATQAVFDSTNTDLDTILSRLKNSIKSNGSGGNSSSSDTIVYTAYRAFSSQTEAENNWNNEVKTYSSTPPPRYWSLYPSKVTVADGQSLYITVAQRANGAYKEWETVNGTPIYWSKPIAIGNGSTSSTGADNNQYNYVYARTKTDTIPNIYGKDSTTDMEISVEVIEKSSDKSQTVNDVVWYDHPQGITDEYICEWIVVFKLTDGKWVYDSGPILWSKWGQNGRDGDGVEYIFYCEENGTAPSAWGSTITGRIGETNTTYNSVIVSNLSTDGNYQQDDFIPQGWHDEPQEVSQTRPKQYVSVRKKKWDENESESKWQMFSEPKLWSSIPIVIEGEDKVDYDWSNDNININLEETDDELKVSTLNELTVTVGSDSIPYLEDNKDSKGRYYTVEAYQANSTIDVSNIHIQNNTDNNKAQVYVSGLDYDNTIYTIGVTITVFYDGTNSTIIHSAYTINVKEVAYDIIVNPAGFSVAKTDVNLGDNVTIKIRKKTKKSGTSFLTYSQLVELVGTNGKFIITVGTTTTSLMQTDGAFDSNITQNQDTWTLDTTNNASAFGFVDTTRRFNIELDSNDGYEDDETIIIARDGETGDEGPGSEYIFFLAAKDMNDSDFSDGGDYNPNTGYYLSDGETLNPVVQVDDYIPSLTETEYGSWSDDIKEVTESNPVLYVSIRRKKGGEWKEFETPTVYNRYIASSYSVSLDNDTAIMDDQATSIDTMNITFTKLRVWHGDTDITQDVYVKDVNEAGHYNISVLATLSNSLGDTATLYRASDEQITAYNNNTQITETGEPTVVSSSVAQTPSYSNGIYFYLKNNSDVLTVGNYSVRFDVTIENLSDNSQIKLTKVQTVMVKDINATGTSYKLIIDNDVWHYDGDDNKLTNTEDQSTSTLSVVSITRGIATNVTSFKVSYSSPNNTSGDTYYNDKETLWIKLPNAISSNLQVDTVSTITDSSKASINFNALATWVQSTVTFELYQGTVLIDSETIDCPKDGKTGKSGTTGYSIQLTNDNAIIDTDSNADSIKTLTMCTATLWNGDSKSIFNNTSGSTTNVISVTTDLEGFNVQPVNGNFDSGTDYSFYLKPNEEQDEYESIDGSITVTVKINSTTTISKNMGISFKALEGKGVSYMLNITPNQMIFDDEEESMGNNDSTSNIGSITVSKIENGNKITNVDYTYNTSIDTNTDGLQLVVENNSNIIVNGSTIRYVLYNKDGYVFNLYNISNGTSTLLDSETLGCVKNGKKGNDAQSPYTIELDNDYAVIDSDSDIDSLKILTTCNATLYQGTNKVECDWSTDFNDTSSASKYENSLYFIVNGNNVSTVTSSTTAQFYIYNTNINNGTKAGERDYSATIIATKNDTVVATKVFKFSYKDLEGVGTNYMLTITPNVVQYGSTGSILSSDATGNIKVALIQNGTPSSEFTNYTLKDKSTSFGTTDSVGYYLLYPNGFPLDTSNKGQFYVNSTQKLSYSITGYTFDFVYWDGSSQILLDSETLGCVRNGANGINGNDAYYIVLDNDTAVIDNDSNANSIKNLTTINAKLYIGTSDYTSNTTWSIAESASDPTKYQLLPDNNTWSIVNSGNGVYYIQGEATEKTGTYYFTIQASIGSVTLYKRFTFQLVNMPGDGVSYKLDVQPQVITFENSSDTKTVICTLTAYEVSNSGITSKAATMLNKESGSFNIGDLHFIVRSNDTIIYNSITYSIDTNNTITLIFKNLSYNSNGFDITLYKAITTSQIQPYDVEHIDCIGVGNNSSVDEAIYVTGSGNMKIDAKNVTFTCNCEYTATDVIDKVVIVFYGMTKNGESNYTINYTNNSSKTFKFDCTLDKSYITTQATRTTDKPTYTINSSTKGQFDDSYTQLSWGYCNYATVTLYNNDTAIYTDTIYRSGTDGYYFDASSAGFISLQSYDNSISQINQTANAISASVVTASPNLLQCSTDNIDFTITKNSSTKNTISMIRSTSASERSGTFNISLYKNTKNTGTLTKYLGDDSFSSNYVYVYSDNTTGDITAQTTQNNGDDQTELGYVKISSEYSNDDKDELTYTLTWESEYATVDTTSTLTEGKTCIYEDSFTGTGNKSVTFYVNRGSISTQDSSNSNISGQTKELVLTSKDNKDGITFYADIESGKTYTLTGYVKLKNILTHSVTTNGSTDTYNIDVTLNDDIKLTNSYQYFKYSITGNSTKSFDIVLNYTYNGTTYDYITEKGQFITVLFSGLTLVEGTQPSAWKPYGISLSSIYQGSDTIDVYVRKGEDIGGVKIDETGSTFKGDVKAETLYADQFVVNREPDSDNPHKNIGREPDSSDGDYGASNPYPVSIRMTTWGSLTAEQRKAITTNAPTGSAVKNWYTEETTPSTTDTSYKQWTTPCLVAYDMEGTAYFFDLLSSVTNTELYTPITGSQWYQIKSTNDNYDYLKLEDISNSIYVKDGDSKYYVYNGNSYTLAAIEPQTYWSKVYETIGVQKLQDASNSYAFIKFMVLQDIIVGEGEKKSPESYIIIGQPYSYGNTFSVSSYYSVLTIIPPVSNNSQSYFEVNKRHFNNMPSYASSDLDSQGKFLGTDSGTTNDDTNPNLHLMKRSNSGTYISVGEDNNIDTPMYCLTNDKVSNANWLNAIYVREGITKPDSEGKDSNMPLLTKYYNPNQLEPSKNFYFVNGAFITQAAIKEGK